MSQTTLPDAADPDFKIGQAYEYGMFYAYMDDEYGNGYRKKPKHPEKVSLAEQQAFIEGYEAERRNSLEA